MSSFTKCVRWQDLSPGTGKVELFLSDLAVTGQVAASTQNQAFNALLFLYREVLRQPFENIQAVRANRPVRVPVVLTIEEAGLRQCLFARRAGRKYPKAAREWGWQYVFPARNLSLTRAPGSGGGIIWTKRDRKHFSVSAF